MQGFWKRAVLLSPGLLALVERHGVDVGCAGCKNVGM